MAAQVPTSVPSTITAGDTAKWTQSFSDYPAGTWTLTYALTPFWVLDAQGGQQITFDATADGTLHLVNQAPAETLIWGAGKYAYQATVTDGTDRYTVDTGTIEILPNLATAGQIDPRTAAQRRLDLVQRSIERLISQQTKRVTIEGVSFEFQDLEQLREIEKDLLAQVANEEMAATGGRRRCILAQFTTPS